VQVGDGNTQVNVFGPLIIGSGMPGVGSHRARRGPWRVFLSHTAELSQYPVGDSFVAAARRAVERARHAVVEMGTWTAADLPPAQLDARKLADCDVYVGIVGFRWGSPVREDPARSYTEAEFDTSSELGLPRLVFLIGEDLEVTVPRSFYLDREYGDRQEAFRARIDECGVTRVVVTSPKDLEVLLGQALTELADLVERTTASTDSGGPPGLGQGVGGGGPVFAVPPPRAGDVARPGLSGQLLDRLTAAGTGVVGMATGLAGAGGFGKTTLARMLVHDCRARESFRDGMVWVTEMFSG
jgi:hypothetical protein